LVVAVMPGAVDTEMERNFLPPKLPPAEAARAALDGVERGLEEVYPRDTATGMSQGLASDPKAVEKDLAKIPAGLGRALSVALEHGPGDDGDGTGPTRAYPIG
jgi:hypothetical protein